MDSFEGGRFYAVDMLLPAARHYRLLSRMRKRNQRERPIAQKLTRLLQYVRWRDVYLDNVMVAAGCSRSIAFRKSIGPHFRAARLFAGSDPTLGRPAWLDDVSVTGIEQIQALRDQRTPVIVCGSHINSGARIAFYLLSEIGVPLAHGTLTPRGMRNLPESVQTFFVDSPLPGYIALREGKVLLQAAEVPAPGTPIKFLGKYVSFPNLVCKMAASVGAAIIHAYAYETSPGAWHIVFDPAIRVDSQDVVGGMQTLMSLSEQAIQAHPFEWVWMGHPFLTHVGFPETGRLHILVGTAGADPNGVRAAMARKLGTYDGIEPTQADLSGQDLAGIGRALHAGQHDLLLLQQPELGNDVQELPGLINWFFREDPAFVAYDPPTDTASGSASISTYSMVFVKTATIDALLAKGVRKLDPRALNVARRAGFSVYHLPTERAILDELNELERAHPDLPAFLKV